MLSELPQKHFACVLADPPWQHKTFSAKGLEGRPQHYGRMALKDICALPVQDVAAKDCWLFLWTTGPHLEQAFQVIKAWGFKYSGMGFDWVKLNPKAGELFLDKHSFAVNLGYTTRKNLEYCLLARRGSPKRLRKDIRALIIAPRREHSRKPDEAHSRIEQFCAGPRLEIFARQSREGWTTWGNETGKFDSHPSS